MTAVTPVVPTGVFPPDLEADLRTTLAPVARELGAVSALVLGWATVDAERAAGQAGAERDAARPAELPDDELLGARCHELPSAGGGPATILLEPVTESRIAASLARHGEGPIALYLRVPPPILGRFRVVAAAAGIRLSRPASGPFGDAVLVLGNPASGPHLLVTAVRPARTIGP